MQERPLDYQPIYGKGVDALERRTPEAQESACDLFLRLEQSLQLPAVKHPMSMVWWSGFTCGAMAAGMASVALLLFLKS